MEQEKKTPKIAIVIGVITFIVVAFISYRLYLFFFVYDGYFTDHNYYLVDNNTTEEQVTSYVEKYMKDTYNKNFSIRFVKKNKKTFCGVLFGCIGTGRVEEIYEYVFKGEDDNGIEFDLSYRNGFKNKGITREPLIEENYGGLNQINNIIKELYDKYSFINDDYVNTIYLYVYDEELNTNTIKELLNQTKDIDTTKINLILTNDINIYNNRYSNTINPYNYDNLRIDDNDYYSSVTDLETFDEVRKKDTLYFIRITNITGNFNIYDFRYKKENN